MFLRISRDAIPWKPCFPSSSQAPDETSYISNLSFHPQSLLQRALPLQDQLFCRVVLVKLLKKPRAKLMISGFVRMLLCKSCKRLSTSASTLLPIIAMIAFDFMTGTNAESFLQHFRRKRYQAKVSPAKTCRQTYAGFF